METYGSPCDASKSRACVDLRPHENVGIKSILVGMESPVLLLDRNPSGRQPDVLPSAPTEMPNVSAPLETKWEPEWTNLQHVLDRGGCRVIRLIPMINCNDREVEVFIGTGGHRFYWLLVTPAHMHEQFIIRHCSSLKG